MSRSLIAMIACTLASACAAAPAPQLGGSVAHNVTAHAAARGAQNPAVAGARLATVLEAYVAGEAKDLDTASTSDVFEEAP